MKQFLIIIITVLLSIACSKIPGFPDPKLDASSMVTDTIRRDTIDTYKLSTIIDAPNGIQVIQILNGRTYQIIEELNQYKGEKKLTLNYPIDLKNINRDTMLAYTVKVIDQQNRSYNKAFRIVVKPFSHPVITVIGGSQTMGVVSSVFEMRMVFETGLNKIKNYTIKFNNNVRADESPIEQTNYLKIKHLFNEVMLLNNTYPVEITLTDDKNNTGVYSFNMKLVQMERPKIIYVSTQSGKNRDIVPVWDNEGKLKVISSTIYSKILVDGYLEERENYAKHEFFYNPNGTMDKFTYSITTGTNSEFTYKWDSSGKLLDFNNEFFFTAWDQYGNPTKGYKGTNPYLIDIKYVDDVLGGGKVFAEFWNSSTISSTSRYYCTDMIPVPIPTYTESFPPFLSGSPDQYLRELFHFKYVFTRAVRQSTGLDHSTVSYITDISGRLTKLRRSTSATSYVEYLFIYE